MTRPAHIDLFSGIGGFALACQWAGIETEVFCENDKFCQRVLKKHWPGVPIVEDIKTFDGTAYAGAFILTGGFPCQPFSCAGKRGGKEDDRYLWPEMFRVITEARPRWVLAENVTGIIKMELDNVLADLEAEGYATGTLIIPACAVNALHRRDRVWIVANCQGKRMEGVWAQREQESTLPIEASISGCNDIRACKFCGYEFDHELLGKYGCPNCEGRGADGGREIEPNMDRDVYGVSYRMDRLKALGNAIVPQVAHEIIKTIMEIDP